MNTKFLPTLGLLGLSLCCRQPAPRVLCTLENPSTGERLQMYEEIWFKTPRGYDETAHIAHWKEQAAERGFTREVR